MTTLLERIESKRDDMVDLTQALVRIPSVNPPGDAYTPCVELIGNRLKRRGFDVMYYRAEGTPGDTDEYPRMNVVARIEGRRPGPCVHFNGHIDVVEVGAGWSTDPFAGVIRDNRIYGRGACDMKGGLAASIVAMEALLELHPNFPGAIEISATADEETGGYGGVAWLAEAGIMASPRIDHVIIPEPLNKDRVCLGHRGVWWAEIETFGRIAHGSMPFLGDSAIRHMFAVLDAFEQRLYPALGTKRTNMPVVPDGARSSTMNINSVHGGQGEHFSGLPAAAVADSCRTVIDRRFLIEEDITDVKAEVRDILEHLRSHRDHFRYELRDLFEVIPTMTEREAPVVTAVSRAVQKVLGKPPQLVVSPGTYDQKHIDRIGRLNNCIAYGPGILDLAHQPDEYIDIDDMVISARVMALAAYELLFGAA
ncbi:MAG: acetylornithine deacetylase/succinyl-diaminopimelate desuccinylase family protein [Pseudomonadales bacterium]|jgi:succinyl-diaminopimelate desuccinylase|nr:acetylornithine deacetylase/succinyl-diaminopimelate desuccinylase family protein [Pseudomonadales bacterium]MDP6472326.1 acetylornithine deacetylase/succinyl-diaminopimelate desuccinylase family protein [Pseudomonadales bacterium]MDP6828122.1 acetylornithine deacetylase/succinyl-diaminopimelate desuccinylase family protein [Pseudomonadales bacterium]MDP6971820.1 acetylornithine deacetylase/succinyl-diaminopimelate desuccinylase family protein [Pseudomonadales bacterium]|tara:strand:- start:305 stop:1573 length:1269 start_codon:yes stop_codon:yes gene_type:complete